MSVLLDGTDDCLSQETAQTWGIADAWTVYVRYKQDAATTSKAVMQISNDMAAPGTSSGIKFITNGVLLLNTSGANLKFYTGLTLSTNWTTVVATWDGATNTFTVYQDGVDITAGMAKVVDNAGTMANSSRDMYVGCSTNDSGSTKLEHFNGQISEVAAWNIIMTADEVAALDASNLKHFPLNHRANNCQFYFPLNEVADGVSADGVIFRDLITGSFITGDDGANNTGLTGAAEEELSYQPYIMTPQSIAAVAAAQVIAERGPFRGINRGIRRGAA